jgi:hypothetical protein
MKKVIMQFLFHLPLLLKLVFVVCLLFQTPANYLFFVEKLTFIGLNI